MDIQFRRFLENQENNFIKFSKVLENFANRSKNKSGLYRKCLDLRNRGEQSIKFLKDQAQDEENKILIQTQRRLPLNFPLPNISVSYPPPPSPNKTTGSSALENEEVKEIIQAKNNSLQNSPEITCQKTPRKSPSEAIHCSPVIEVSILKPLIFEGKLSKKTAPSLEVFPGINTPDSLNRSSSPSVRSQSNMARFTEKWIEATHPAPSPVQIALNQLDIKIDKKAKATNKTYKKNELLLEQSLEQKLSSLIPQSVIPNSPGVVLQTPETAKGNEMQVISPSLCIRHLSSHGHHLCSSGLDEHIDLKESLNSQILIKDEIVSRFREDDETSDKPTKEISYEVISSPEKDEDSSRVIRLNSPNPEEFMPKIVQQLELSPSPEKKDVVNITQENSSLKTSEQQSCSIDFTKLTLEDKSYAIADFILENLIMEVFSCSQRLREKMVEGYRRIVNSRGANTVNEIIEYMAQVFTFINESPEEQMDIYTRLNTPIIHSDLNRLLLASALVDPSDQIAISALPYESVLNIQMYIKLEEDLRDSIYTDEGLTNSQVEREHIFHKLIFDSLNEKLDYERVGGLRTILPTFFSAYRPEKRITPEDCATILEKGKKEVLEWSLERNGLLPENLRREAQCEEVNIEALDLAREDALTKHLNSYILQQEDKWLDFSDEILEVFLSLSDFAFDLLMEETVASLISIKNSKNCMSADYREDCMDIN